MSHNVWFLGDPHYNHERIIEFCDRPFGSVEEMNELMIQWHNELVKPGDVVYVVGDFQFVWGKKDPADAYVVAPHLNGSKYLIRGNHDRTHKWHETLTEEFVWIRDLETISIKGYGRKGHPLIVALCHYPFRSWNRKFHGAIHLHGHVHGLLDELPVAGALDVGVDVWNYRPVHLDQVLEAIDVHTYWEMIQRIKHQDNAEIASLRRAA